MKKFSMKDIVLMLIGILLCVISLAKYYNFKSPLLNIINGIITGFYSCFYMYYGLGKKLFNGKEKYIFPAVFLVVLFGFILVMLIMSNPLGDFGYDYYLWSLYIESGVIPVLYFVLVYFSNEEYRYDRR